jgi:class 3 adenylate cyclase
MFCHTVDATYRSAKHRSADVADFPQYFAARIEALNKDFNSQFLISQAVRNALGEDGKDALALSEVPKSSPT